MSDRPKRMLIQPDGCAPYELGEEETAMLYTIADEDGVTPAQALRSTIHMTHLLTRHGLMKKAKRT